MSNEKEAADLVQIVEGEEESLFEMANLRQN